MLIAILKSIIIIVGGLVFSAICGTLFTDPSAEYMFAFSYIVYAFFVTLVYLNLIFKK